MCTVTFIPCASGVFLTSNRDEKFTRMTAAVPRTHFVNGYELLYPTDADAGGSWIAVKHNGHAAVLLNGAFVNHIPEKDYRVSRGVLFVELISAKYPDQYFHSTNLNGVAPFTVILYMNKALHEYRWDGTDKHVMTLNTSRAYIWSSVTLYDAGARIERETWLRKWLMQTKSVDMDAIFLFHRFGGKGDIENDLVMNRAEQLSTVSITSVHIQSSSARMNYLDMKQNKAYSCSINLVNSSPGQVESFFEKLLYSLKKSLIVAGNWEYWPFHLVYAPLYLYWFYLSIKARSFFFFSQANPSIENAGFTNERKSRIYAMMPQQYYPKTVVCKQNMSIENITALLAEKSIGFPMIAKPDIGERGTQVKLLHSIVELETYTISAKVDFLIQEFISYENEVGIFYYRIPGEKSGKISGIVGKEFLSVTGDGRSTIEELLKKNKRSFLQIPALRTEYGQYLKTVLPNGEFHELVPYGNHARGSRFIDLNRMISEQLTVSIDQFCHQVPDFYFGRLDIKFRSWDDLCEGKHFSVIELNGAGSEPTHIYDTSHSLFFAWKEIIRHWHLLYKISSLNAQRTGMRFLATGKGLQLLKEHRAHMKLITCNEK